MQLRIWKRVFLTPFVRLNFYTRGVTVSFGKRGLGWITFGRRGVRATVPTGIPGAYLSEAQTWGRLWKWRPRAARTKKQ
jgi:hypothetical protein